MSSFHIQGAFMVLTQGRQRDESNKCSCRKIRHSLTVYDAVTGVVYEALDWGHGSPQNEAPFIRTFGSFCMQHTPWFQPVSLCAPVCASIFSVLRVSQGKEKYGIWYIKLKSINSACPRSHSVSCTAFSSDEYSKILRCLFSLQLIKLEHSISTLCEQ